MSDMARHCGGIGRLVEGSADVIIGGPASAVGLMDLIRVVLTALNAARIVKHIPDKKKKEIQDLIDQGKKQEAADKAAEALSDAGFDMSVMKNGKPTYDPSDPNYGSTPRMKNPEVTVGDAAFADAPTLLTTVAHERKHAEQWADPSNAQAMGRDARELEGYFEEIRHEDNFGVSEAMKQNNRQIAEGHYKNLSEAKKKEYKSAYETLIGAVPH